jgi:hypothetical protein
MKVSPEELIEYTHYHLLPWFSYKMNLGETRWKLPVHRRLQPYPQKFLSSKKFNRTLHHG